MSELKWDEIGERYYESGVSHGVFYPYDVEAKEYKTGVVWNGLTSVSENPDGADANALYADNIKYLNLRGVDDFKATVEAFFYPDEFAECDGSRAILDGITIGEQVRVPFGFSYQTKIGSDVNPESGYKIHLVYGCTVSPSDKNYETEDDSPDAATFSWDLETTPVAVAGYKPTAHLEIDSRVVSPTLLKKITDKLYGTTTSEPTFLTPNQILALAEEDA